MGGGGLEGVPQYGRFPLESPRTEFPLSRLGEPVGFEDCQCFASACQFYASA